MKTEPILADIEQVKDRLALAAGDDTRRFLDQMEEWFAAHPHPGPVIGSPRELQARLATGSALPPPEVYRVQHPVLEEVMRIRTELAEPKAEGAADNPECRSDIDKSAGRNACVLREEPPRHA